MAKSLNERILWTKKTSSLTDLLLQFESQFPVLVVTSCGFHGANEIEVVSAGEILRAHSSISQWRVFAYDVRGKIFSLPLTLPDKFEVIKQNGKKSKPKELSEIIDDYELPLRICLASDSEYLNVGEMKYNNTKLGFLTLYKCYDEWFLRLNTITRGIINKRCVHLPLYVQIEVSVAKGFKDGSDDEWDTMMAKFDRAVSSASVNSLDGLNEVLIYDPSEGKIINPQAMYAFHGIPGYSLGDSSMQTEMLDSKVRQTILSDRLSGIKLDGNQRLVQRGSVISYYPDNNKHFSKGNQSIAFEKMPSVDGSKRIEDDFYETKANNGVHTKKIAVASKSDSPGNMHMDKKFRAQNGESPQLETKSAKKEKDSGENIPNIETKIANISDEIDGGKVREETGFEPQTKDDHADRIKPLSTPIPAKRRFTPTGKVSPMIRESSSNKMETTNTSDSTQTEPLTKYPEFASVKIDHLHSPEQTSGINTLPSQTTGITNRYGAQVEPESTDEAFHVNLAQTTGLLVPNGGQDPPVKSKKSALKADRRRTSRAKRHVSYSDTDTVYPFDSTDDMADDSEVDSPFRRTDTDIFADSLRNRMTLDQIRNNPLSVRRSSRQAGNLVVNVHPGRQRQNNFFPAITRKPLHGSDGSVSSRFNTPIRHPGIDVIPEIPEDYPGIGNNRSKQYFEMANYRDPGLDSNRRNTVSVVSVGNLRYYDNDLSRPSTRQQQQYLIDSSSTVTDSRPFSSAAIERNSFASNNNNYSLKRKTPNGTANRRTIVDDFAVPTAWRSDQKTMTMNGIDGHGFLSQPEYRFRMGHQTNRAGNQQNLSSKVIQLNETRDGNKWAEISDMDKRGTDPNYLVFNGTATKRPKDTNYLPPTSSINRHNTLQHSLSTGILTPVTVNGVSPLIARTARNSMYNAVVGTGTVQTLPWNARYNTHNASKRTISSSNSPVLERNRAGRKIIPIS